MQLRTFHRLVGAIFAPFFILTAVTGIILLWRKDDLYSASTKGTLLGLHNWEGLAPLHRRGAGRRTALHDLHRLGHPGGNSPKKTQVALRVTWWT